MGDRKQIGIGGCDIWIVVYAIVALSAATDVYAFARFAPALGLPPWTGALWVIPIKFVEWKFLTFAACIFRSGLLGKFVFIAPTIAWCIAVALSMLAAHSTIHHTLASADRIQAKKVETRSNLSSALIAIDAQRKSLSDPKVPRPAKVVEEALAWVALPEDVRRSTRNCTRFANDNQREACKPSMVLRQELAAAKEYERLIASSSLLRARLEGLEIEGAEEPMSRSFEISFGRFIELDGKDGIAFMGMGILTLVSSLGPFGLYLVGRSDRPELVEPATAAVVGECAQGQDGPQSAQAEGDQPKRSKSAHPESAHPESAHGKSALGKPAHAQSAQVPAHAVSPEVKIGKTSRVPPATMPSCSLGEPAHVPAQEIAMAVQDEPAHEHSGARPPMLEPAQSSSRRVGRANDPARPRAPHVAQRTSRFGALHADRRLEALTAVRSFVMMLEKATHARATGSALADAFEALRPVHGWPQLAPNVFGMLLRVAVDEVGGRKLKSGGQVYVGVRIPAEWSRQVAA